VNETVAFDSNIMWDEVYTEDEELYKTKVLTLENTFKGTL
jgi:hypothetical protein